MLYSRVSRDRSRRRKSVTEQDKEGRDAAAYRKWTIPEDAVFTDNARSASRFARKPRIGWAAVLAYLAANPVYVLILWEVSRGDRQLGSWIALLDLCRDRGIYVHIVKDDETYDPRDPRDRRYLALEGIDAEGEADRTSKRILRDKRAAALDGRPAGRLNYGYRRIYDDRGYYVETVFHPTQAMIKRDIIDAGILTGRSLTDIARDLNQRRRDARSAAWRAAREVATTTGTWDERRRAIRIVLQEGRIWDAPEGGPWVPPMIRRIALNPAYAGKRVHQGVVVGDAAWPAMTSERDYNLIVARLTDPARRLQESTTLSNQLSGAAICGRCDGVVRIGHSTKYRCSACFGVAVLKVDADRIIDKLIIGRLRDRAAMAVFIAPSNTAAAQRAEDERKVLQARLDAHYKLAATGELTARGISLIERELLPKIEAAATAARELSAPPALEGLEPEMIADTWPDQPVAVRRGVILALAEVKLSPAGKGRKATPWRFAESRWRGAEQTWGEIWLAAGESPTSAGSLTSV